MVLFMLCSAVLVEWLLLKPFVWNVVCGVVSSPVVLLSLREVRWVCMICLCLCPFGMRIDVVV